MPEQPDLVALTETLTALIVGKEVTIINGETQRKCHLNSITVRGKYVLFTFDTTPYLMAHFGLLGTLIVTNMSTQKSTRLLLHRKNTPMGNDVIHLICGDLKFGFNYGTGCSFDFVNDPFDVLQFLGPDVGSEQIDTLVAMIQSSKIMNRSLESVLSDQNLFAGMGKRWRYNIYSTMDIDPKTKLKTLCSDEFYQIFKIAISVYNQMKSKAKFELEKSIKTIF